jgi:N-acetylmuramoyl-L-alanine amidase CwlA
MTITDKLLSPGASHARPMKKMTPQGCIIHYVGNPNRTAIGNRNYFESSGVASAHYVVGLEGEILRCIPDDETAWHAGKSYSPKYTQMAKTNNNRFIGIEVCHPLPDGKFKDVTRSALIELCVELCKKHGFNPNDDIIRHYDCTGKCCPAYYVNNPDEWKRLKADIVSAFSSAAPSQKITETLDISSEIPILAPPSASMEQMQAWARNKKSADFFVELASVFYEISVSCGVNPVVSYCQSALETGCGKFGGVIDETYHNPCGMKKSIGGGDYAANAHMRFPTWEEGIAAQVDHLALYAGAAGYPKIETPDPRHFASLFGKAETVDDLTGKWATDPQYAVKLNKLIEDLQAIQPDTAAENPSAIIPPVGMNGKSPDGLSDWALDAWYWAKKSGITDGTRPGFAATREEVWTMLYNALVGSRKR